MGGRNRINASLLYEMADKIRQWTKSAQLGSSSSVGVHSLHEESVVSKRSYGRTDKLTYGRSKMHLIKSNIWPV